MLNQSSSLWKHDWWKLHSSSAMSRWSKKTRDGGTRSEWVMPLALLFTISLETCYFINAPESHRWHGKCEKSFIVHNFAFLFYSHLKKPPDRVPQGRSWCSEGGMRRRWSVGQWSGRGNASHGGRTKVWWRGDGVAVPWRAAARRHRQPCHSISAILCLRILSRWVYKIMCLCLSKLFLNIFTLKTVYLVVNCVQKSKFLECRTYCFVWVSTITFLPLKDGPSLPPGRFNR